MYRLPVSPGPDLAGLGTSVGVGLMSLNIGTHGLGSSSWAFGTHSTHEQILRDPCDLNDYMDQEIEFQRQSIIAQEHLAMVSRDEHQASDSLMQIPSLELDTDSSLTQLESLRAQPQGLEGFTASSIDDKQETEFDELSFFNEASVSDHESEDDEQSVICHVPEPDKTSIEGASEEPRTLEQPMIEDVVVPSGDPAFQAGPHDIITVDDDDASNDDDSLPMSTPPASNSLDRDELMQIPPDAIECAQEQATEKPLDVSDVIKNRDKAYDIIKALKEQGLLAELLEKVHYEIPKETGTAPKADALIQHDMSKNTYICSMTDCKKAFPRNCELK